MIINWINRTTIQQSPTNYGLAAVSDAMKPMTGYEFYITTLNGSEFDDIYEDVSYSLVKGFSILSTVWYRGEIWHFWSRNMTLTRFSLYVPQTI